MRDAAREAIDFSRGRARGDLDHDRLFELPMVRLMEIGGEAASKVSPDFRANQPEFPWPLIVGLRNRLIHGYDSVNLDVLWETITNDLPPLVASLDRMVADLPPDGPRS
jgi:uncharacterized protein with HEPN domain